ncbi:MAG: desulfoferrodoxin [Spirochaetaceae bacterium]|jgi:superoxide reductase|nr:desulfoferrodoxin [Spirochaetaceae bacterium]
MKVSDIYKCEVCGNIVEVINVGGGELVCCGQKMVQLEEKTADSATEKHVPIIEKTKGGYIVTVGSTLHPMTEEHWIQWIELHVDGQILRQELTPADKPQATFSYSGEAKKVTAREFCNLHGLWKGE